MNFQQDVPVTPEICQTTVNLIINGAESSRNVSLSPPQLTFSSRRTWTSEETVALIGFYGDRKAEFDIPRKKKQAWENLLHDMESSGVLVRLEDIFLVCVIYLNDFILQKGPVAIQHLENTMKGLIKAYKCSVDSEGLTGQGTASSPFYGQLNEIFGNTVIGSAQHTIAVGATEISLHQRAVPVSPPVPGDTSKQLRRDIGGSKRKKEQEKVNRHEEKKKILLDFEAKQQKRHDDKMVVENRSCS